MGLVSGKCSPLIKKHGRPVTTGKKLFNKQTITLSSRR